MEHTREDCKYYIKGNAYRSIDAPDPGHSMCLDIEECTYWSEMPLPELGQTVEEWERDNAQIYGITKEGSFLLNPPWLRDWEEEQKEVE